MADGKNKTALVGFLFSVWCAGKFHVTNDIQTFYAHGEICHSLVIENGSLRVTRVNELRCNYEEV